MIICYYTVITTAWSNDEMEQKLTHIPADIKQRISLKRKHIDQQLTIGGNLLLLELIKHFKLDLTLNDLTYNQYRRPYFNAGFDFNISHSGNIVTCCATTNGKVGIDIELTGNIDFNYDDYFTVKEQQNIRNNTNPNSAFYKYWARKEALLKAVGTGIFTPLLAIDVSADSFVYKGIAYHLSPIIINSAYQSCIAHTAKQDIMLKAITGI